MPIYRYQMKSKNYLNTLQGYLYLKNKLSRFQPVNIDYKAFIPDYIQMKSKNYLNTLQGYLYLMSRLL